jgi:hypothetical protein
VSFRTNTIAMLLVALVVMDPLTALILKMFTIFPYQNMETDYIVLESPRCGAQ